MHLIAEGTKMFVVGITGDKVYEYNLDNPATQTVAIDTAITMILPLIQQVQRV